MNENVTVINIGAKTIYLLGTAHVSKESADEAYDLIREMKPDTVCIELDNERLNNLKNQDQWKEQDIITIIKQKKSAFIKYNLSFHHYKEFIIFGINIIHFCCF